MHNSLESKRDDIVKLCQIHGVSRLDLFGSAASNNFDTDSSDVDFLVEFAEPASGDHFEQYFAFREDLEALLGRSVDLVSEKAITNPHFRESVLNSRETLYAA